MSHYETETTSRVEGGRKALQFLKRIGAYNFFQGLRKDVGDDTAVSFEEFQSFLDRINGILRSTPKAKRGADGERVYLKGAVDETQVPLHADKRDILRTAFDAALKLKNRDDVAFLLPVIVNAIHMYADGNGRTSRALHLLLRQFPSNTAFEEELTKAVGEDGRYESFNLDPDIVYQDIRKIQYAKHGFEFSDPKNWSPMFPEGYATFFTVEPAVTPNSKKLLSLSRSDKVYSFIASRDYLESVGKLENVLTMLDHGKAISLTRMEEGLSQEDWDNIFRGYFDLKREHVKILIESFVNPEQYRSVDGSKTIRDVFIEEVENFTLGADHSK